MFEIIMNINMITYLEFISLFILLVIGIYSLILKCLLLYWFLKRKRLIKKMMTDIQQKKDEDTIYFYKN